MTPGLTHPQETCIAAQETLKKLLTDPKLTEDQREAVGVVLDTVRDLAQGIVHLSKPRLDPVLAGKIIDGLLRPTPLMHEGKRR